MNTHKKLLSFATLLLASVLFVPQTFASNLEAHMTGAKVTAINGTTLTVVKNGKTVTLTTDAKTIVVRRFNGRSTLSQISVGDFINFAGTWTDPSDMSAYAKLIRDGSIQERHDTFSGSVVATGSSSFVLQTMHRDQETVNVTGSTTIKNKTGNTLALSGIAVGDTIVVDGMWDRTLKTIAATTIRDLSQPVGATPSAKGMMRRYLR